MSIKPPEPSIKKSQAVTAPDPSVLTTGPPKGSPGDGKDAFVDVSVWTPSLKLNAVTSIWVRFRLGGKADESWIVPVKKSLVV